MAPGAGAGVERAPPARSTHMGGARLAGFRSLPGPLMFEVWTGG